MVKSADSKDFTSFMSGEDGEVDDGPPVLVAFEYPPEETGTELPLDNDEPPEVLNHHNMHHNNNYEGTVSDDEGEASSQDAGEVIEEGEDQESTKASSESKRRKRRHHRRSKSHRKKESSKSSSAQNAKDSITHNLVSATSVVAPVGEWATLLSMYQQHQFPQTTGDEARIKMAGESSPSKKRKDANKSQYDVDDADPYATPEVSEDEDNGPQQTVAKEPFNDHNTSGGYQPYSQDYRGRPYPPESTFPPRKRIRDEAFGSHERGSSPFRGRDRYFDRGGRGYRHNYDDYYDDRRPTRSPSDQWGRGGSRRDRGGRRPRRGREYNDFDQPLPEMPPTSSSYDPRHYEEPYSSGPNGPDSFRSQQEAPYQSQDFDHDRSYGHHPESFDGPRGFDEDRLYSGRGRDRGGRGRKPDRVPPGNAPERPGMVCKFFREGNCLKGSNCTFAHLMPSEMKRKPELCKFYLGGFCIKGNDCDYMHEQFPCKFFHMVGNCRNGDHCRFSHAPLDDEGRMMLDKAIASWTSSNTNAAQAGQTDQSSGYYDEQQLQSGANNYPPQPYNGNGTQGALYGNDVLSSEQVSANGPPFQSPPQAQPTGQQNSFMPGGFEGAQPPFQGGGTEFMPPPPNFPPIPPFPPGCNQPGSFFPPNPQDLGSPPQFRPPVPGQPGLPSPGGYQPPQMPPLPPTLSAEQIHQLASGMPGMPPGMPPPPFQSPPILPASTPPASQPTEANSSASDPRVNRTSSDASTSSNNANRLIRYKLMSVLIPPPVPLSLALKLDPLDPIIRLDPRLRKVFGVSSAS